MDKKLLADIIQWDIKNWGKAIPFWQPFVDSIKNGKAAAFGEREGGLSLWLALNDYHVQCSDYNGMDTVPLELHVSHKVEEKITYSKQDITSTSFEDNTFDIVMFKSVIGTLNSKERQQQAIDELYRILKPGGYLLFAENLEATGMHRFGRKKFTNWGHRWRYLKWKEMPSMLSQFETSKMNSRGFLATFGRSEGQRKFLSGIDWVLNPILPKSWKYVLFVASKKPMK
ncbi:MAG: SAM-dependent methyltransferase [Crocinitomicaceae bacterium]